MRRPVKKNLIHKPGGAILALAFLLNAALPAFASEALGWELHAASRPLSEGARLASGWFWSDTYSDLRAERYVSYVPNPDVTPSVSYGGSVLEKNTVEALARTLEQAGKRVVGGTNGDFYVVATGTPLGILVTDGILRSSSSYHYAVGFRADGTAFVGQPALKIIAVLPDGPMDLGGGVNKIPGEAADADGVFLFTDDFSDSTKNGFPGVDVFLSPLSEDLGRSVPAEETPTGEALAVSGALKIGGRVRCLVTSVVETGGASEIPAGGFILSVNAARFPALAERLRALQAGQEISIDIASPDERWTEAAEAVGGIFRLLEDGSPGPGLRDNGGNRQSGRTAIGVREDGTVLFYTIDGRQPGLSVGATCEQTALRLRELGCVDAIGLDGGGSTTLGVTYPGSDALEVINSPSDGFQRAVSNAVFLTTGLTPGGEAGNLELHPGDAVLLSGMTLDFSARVLDTRWYDMGEADGAVYTLSGAGSVTPEGRFTAGEAGQAVVTGTLDGLSGTAAVTVTDTLTELSLVDEATGETVTALALNAGESVELQAVSAWNGLALPRQDTAFAWDCDTRLGTVTQSGTFTAGKRGRTGTLSVRAGGQERVIPVTVTVEPQSWFLDMEGHWAAPYANRLYELGVTNGVNAGEDLFYQPESQITRAEFFTMAARWLELDLSACEDIELPFSDAGDIPDWALDALRALYDRGAIAGSPEEDGLRANPGGLVSRAEAVTILGRMTGPDIGQDTLERFPDAGTVPEWALEYMERMAGLEIIQGYDDGTLRPGEPLTRAQAAKILCVLDEKGVVPACERGV